MQLQSPLDQRFFLHYKYLVLGMLQMKRYMEFKALSHDAIFLATFNAILLLDYVKLANTSFHQSLPIYF